MKKIGRKQLVLASLVLALGAAVYLNWQFAGTNKLPVGDASSTSSQLGAAQLVNNAYVETVNDDLQSSSSAGTVDAFAEARLTRQNSRDEAMELLDNVLADLDGDTQAKEAAVEQASAMAQCGGGAESKGVPGMRGLPGRRPVQRGGFWPAGG